MDNKTIKSLQTSTVWRDYEKAIKKIIESPFRLNCFRLGDVCQLCHQLYDKAMHKQHICETCWNKCECGIIVNPFLFTTRCVHCKIIFCKDCIDLSIPWKDYRNFYREYETCRKCCDPHCFRCGNSYDFETATRQGIIYPSLDPSIFELKFPKKDIKGKVTSY